MMSPAFEYCLTKMSLIALKGSTQERPEESLSLRIGMPRMSAQYIRTMPVAKSTTLAS